MLEEHGGGQLAGECLRPHLHGEWLLVDGWVAVLKPALATLLSCTVAANAPRDGHPVRVALPPFCAVRQDGRDEALVLFC